MDNEDKDNSGSKTHQDYLCPFCDVKIKEKEDVINHLESCHDANLCLLPGAVHNRGGRTAAYLKS